MVLYDMGWIALVLVGLDHCQPCTSPLSLFWCLGPGLLFLVRMDCICTLDEPRIRLSDFRPRRNKRTIFQITPKSKGLQNLTIGRPVTELPQKRNLATGPCSDVPCEPNLEFELSCSTIYVGAWTMCSWAGRLSVVYLF